MKTGPSSNSPQNAICSCFEHFLLRCKYLSLFLVNMGVRFMWQIRVRGGKRNLGLSTRTVLTISGLKRMNWDSRVGYVRNIQPCCLHEHPPPLIALFPEIWPQEVLLLPENDF